MNVGLIVAAGQSERFGGGDKQFALLAGRPLLGYSLAAVALARTVDAVVLVVAAENSERCRTDIVDPAKIAKPVSIVGGGRTRQQSVAAGLAACPRGTELVWVHDGARPLITSAQVDLMAANLNNYDGLVLAVPVSDTIKQVEDGVIKKTIPRDQLWQAQTPQVFKYSTLEQAHKMAAMSGFSATDDAALVELMGGRVAVWPNDRANIKVTTRADLLVAEETLRDSS